MADRGSPRIQYSRTYVLLPPNAGQAWAVAALNATWNKHRYTVGSSADDAGIGDLDVRRVLAVNPDEWGDLRAFFDQYYPGVEYMPVHAETPAQLERVLSLPDPTPESSVLLGQGDLPWGPMRYAQGRCATYSLKGCWITDCAMAQRWYGIDSQATPLTVDTAVGSAGYTSTCRMLWSAMPALGLEVVGSTTSNEKARAHILDGGVAFAEVAPANLEHFVLVTEWGPDGPIMHDPWKRVVAPLTDHYAGVDSWRLISCVAQPEPLFPMRGVHDLAGADWMLAQGLQGWCTVAVYVGTDMQHLDYTKYEQAGIRVIANLRYSYAVDDGGRGTIAPLNELPRFEDAVVSTIANAKGVWGFVYCNEMNNVREWPRDTVLTPEYYLESYNHVASRIGQQRLSPGAIDPYNAGWQDWRVTWKWALENLYHRPGFYALHAYSHGKTFDPDQVFGDDPLRGVYYNLRVLESQLDIIPHHISMPIIVTECNHGADGSHWGDDSGPWVRNALAYFDSQAVDGVCLFRFNYSDDRWRFGDHGNVLEVLREWK